MEHTGPAGDAIPQFLESAPGSHKIISGDLAEARYDSATLDQTAQDSVTLGKTVREYVKYICTEKRKRKKAEEQKNVKGWEKK